MAEYHTQPIKDAGAQLVGVADVNIESARRLAQKCGISNAYSSMEALLHAHQLDVVHIVTPPAEHYKGAKTAIEHGVSVFVEKPVVFTAEQACELYNQAARKGVLVCPDFLLLFHPKMQEVLRLIDSGRLGRILHVDSHLRVDSAALQSSETRDATGLHWRYTLPGGVLHNYITHPLYVALYFTGRLKNVTTLGKAYGSLPQNLVDHLTVQLDGEKCSASVVLSLQLRPATQDLRIHGERGSVYINFDWQIVTVDLTDSLPRVIHRGISPYLHAARLSREATSSIWKFLRGKGPSVASLSVLTSRFYESILNAAEPPISRDLTVDVVKAEDHIFRQAGKLHIDTRDRPSQQTNVDDSMRILVTGGTGYVGYHVVKHLVEAGYYVRAIVRPTSRIERLESLGVEVVFGDVRSIDDVRRASEGVDAVVHMAAAVTGTSELMLETAVHGTQNITRVAAELHMKRGIYLSSMSVYDFSTLKNGDRISEDSSLEEQPELRGAYTLAKRRAEDVILLCLEQRNPTWTILRPAVIVGKRNPATGVAKRLGRTLLCFASPGKKLRLIHVDDVASAVVQLLTKEATEGHVFILSNDSITVKQYLQTCIQAERAEKLRVIYIPLSLAWLMGFVRSITGRGAGLNRRQLSYMYRDVGADSSLLTNKSGIQPHSQLLERLLAESTSSK
jgi:UDP-glucose 4-epimerase